MRVSSSWLAEYLGTDVPKPADVARLLTFHAFEVEGFEKSNDDTLFDIGVLPNRAHDCLSHRGIARELAAVLNAPMKDDPLGKPVDLSLVSRVLSVVVDDPVRVPRYAAAVVRGVSVGPSPRWLRERLEALGQKSINNIVDATNFVLLGIGQPTHAFDLDTFSMDSGTCSVRVRPANAGEKIITLDGVERTLTEKMMIISDGKSGTPLGIAGVKGGAHSAISEKTKDIIIESANFNSVSVRKTAQALTLRTDASVRFENGLSPELAGHGLREVVALILKIAGGSVEGYVDYYPRPRNPYVVGVSEREALRILGTDLSADDVARVFDRLGFSYERVKPAHLVAECARALVGAPYAYGASVSYDAPKRFDCSSFVTYLFSRAGISVPRMTVDQFVFGEEISKKDLKPGDVVFSRAAPGETSAYTRVADGARVEQPTVHEASREFLSGTLVSGGISHCGVYVGSGEVAHAYRSGGAAGVVVEDLSSSTSFATIVGYRRMISENDERFVVTVPFERLDLRSREDLVEEIGRIRGYETIVPKPLKKHLKVVVDPLSAYGGRVRAALVARGYSEVYTYAFRGKGDTALENALAADRSFLRPSLAPGIRESLDMNVRNADLLGISPIRIFEIGMVFTKEGERTTLAVGVSGRHAAADAEVAEAASVLGRVLGVALEPFRVGGKDGIAEYDFGRLVASLPAPSSYPPLVKNLETKFAPFSAYPFALRDVAVWVPVGTPRSDLEDIVRKAAGPLLVRLTPFDEFKKGDRVSYALRLVFQSHERTLTDAELGSLMEGVGKSIEKSGWEVR